MTAHKLTYSRWSNADPDVEEFACKCGRTWVGPTGLKPRCPEDATEHPTASWLSGFEAGYDLAAGLARAQVEARGGLAGALNRFSTANGASGVSESPRASACAHEWDEGDIAGIDTCTICGVSQVHVHTRMEPGRIGVGAVKRGEFYYLGYNPMGYRHAYKREVSGSRIGRTEIKLTRDPNHPPDPKCPGCVEVKCPECGRSTHPSLSPCIHQPDGPEWDERTRALYRKSGLRFR